MDIMKNSETGISGIVFRLYHDMVKYEAVETGDSKPSEGLTVNELHLIECIRLNTTGGKGPAISTIASALDITRPSATVAVNKLAKKKIVAKTDSTEDGRSVRVKLTAKGEKALEVHSAFQERFTEELKAELGEDGYDELLKTFGSFGEILDKKIDDLTGRTQKLVEKEKKNAERASAKRSAATKKSAAGKTAAKRGK